MRKFCLTVSGIIGILFLILAFENIGTSASVMFLFQSVKSSLFSPFLLMFVMGVIAGFCLGVAQSQKDQGGGAGDTEF